MQRQSARYLLAALLMLPLPARSQDARTVAMPATREYVLRSAINGRPYRLHIALPEGYADTDTTRYPVLYILDGNLSFPIATAAHRLLRIFGEVPEVIIVGVSYDAATFMDTFASRWSDYTPSRDSASDASFARQYLAARPGEQLRSGGAAAFLRVLKQEVLPAVEARVRATSDRGLWGHSFGGLFALYVLFEEPGLFARYSINSPSLWWNQRESIAREAAYARTHVALPARVFLSIGDGEGPALFETFTSTVAGRGYRQLELQSHVFEGETHTSVVPATFSRSFRFLYPATKRP
jgi:predicted alpha/beta superfamily hydrolase